MLGSLSALLLAFEGLLSLDDRRPDPRDFTSELRLNGTTYRLPATRAAIDEPVGAILIAGDSFTAGLACADGRTYPIAFTKAAVRSGAGVHAVNMGMAGTGPISYARVIKDCLAEIGTAAGLILTLSANDVEVDCDACRTLRQWSDLGGFTAADREALARLCAPCLQVPGQRLAGEVDASRRMNWWLAGHLRTYRLLREATARLAAGSGLLDVGWGRGVYPRQWRDVDGVHFKYIRAGIELAREEADARHVPMMAVIYPDPMGLNEKNEYVALYETAALTLTRSTGVPVYSGYGAFLGNSRSRENMPFSLTDSHPSCEANAIFGEWVFEKWNARTAGDR